MRRKLAVGNWKMNGTAEALIELKKLTGLAPENGPEVVICPPATLLHRAREAVSGTGIGVGAQDCHTEQSGAFTGDVSARMIADAGATFVILGHSERRDAHNESDAMVRAKTLAAKAAGLTVILCVGESLEARSSDETLQVIGRQLEGSLPDTAEAAGLIVAYEPIWAIGTGKVPTLPQIEEVHDFIRATLEKRYGAPTGEAIALLYGGSVKADNAAEIFTAQNVDGALVGGASLTASDFGPIVSALASS